jgi:CelD/BcsL family acetyltransferase involved in cellulose biosynthesis
MSTIAFLHGQAPTSVIDRQRKVQPRTSAHEGLFTEIVGFDELTRLTVPWADLVTRALEPNVFLEPSFAIPLFQHCHNCKNLKFLLAWVQDGPSAQHQLVGLLPVTLPPFFFFKFARSTSHPLAPLGTPLFDRDRGAEALDHMIRWFQEHQPHVKGLVLSLIPKDGATFSMIRVHEKISRFKLAIFKEHLRAVLSKAIGADAFPNGFISTKRRNNYRQQRRRLSQSGEVTYRTISDPIAIRNAAEAFLSLEFKGWKGARRTALLAASSETTFFRAMTRLMSLEGKCRIDSLDIGDTPIAMGVVLTSGDRDFYW